MPSSVVVVPFTGAWIEISADGDGRYDHLSFPSRERGLKLPIYSSHAVKLGVAPFTGAWIEITATWRLGTAMRVVPFTGAWIEISRSGRCRRRRRSLPSRERGLKSGHARGDGGRAAVAPFTGAWIEIRYRPGAIPRPYCRSLHGSVD